MQKIMFNDRFGLTQAVIDGRKTMTRRIINDEDELYNDIRCMKFSHINGYGLAVMSSAVGVVRLVPKYKICEEVAVSQSYSEIYEELKRTHGSSSSVTRDFFHKYIQGGRMPVSNKMFVKAKVMPHRIKITNIKVEKLQDISDDDCFKEGIRIYGNLPAQSKDYIGSIEYIPPFGYDDYKLKIFRNLYTPREAFSELIDRVSGKGTWDSNPYCFCYEFKLIK